MLSFFPQGVLDEILNLIESVSEGFPSYSWFKIIFINLFLLVWVKFLIIILEMLQIYVIFVLELKYFASLVCLLPSRYGMN